MNDLIQITGLVPLTTIDFPGRLAAVAFCQGCPWRCSYCHNAHLQSFTRTESKVAWNDFLAFLNLRRGFLDGVIFSGGEPTYQDSLPEAIRQVKSLGFEIGLHTAGPDRARLEAVLPWLDWVGFDMKAPLDEGYDQLVGRNGSALRVKESLEALLRSGVDYQIRTTFDPSTLADNDLETINRQLEQLGAKPTVVQAYRPPPQNEDCQIDHLLKN